MRDKESLKLLRFAKNKSYETAGDVKVELDGKEIFVYSAGKLVEYDNLEFASVYGGEFSVEN